MRFDRSRKALALCLAVGGSALAQPASASEGTLQIIPDLRLVTLLIVFFLILVPVLQRLLFAPLLGVLDERDKKIEGTQARAAELQKQAESEFGRHEAAVREARMEGERAYKAAVAAAQTNHSQSIAAARSESGRLLESARQDIGGALVEARRVLETQSRELAREAAARILGRSLS